MPREGEADTVFLQVCRSSECQADKHTGRPDGSPAFMPQLSLPPLEPLSIPSGQRPVAADYIGHPAVVRGDEAIRLK